MRIYLVHEDLWDCIEDSAPGIPKVNDNRKQLRALAKRSGRLLFKDFRPLLFKSSCAASCKEETMPIWFMTNRRRACRYLNASSARGTSFSSLEVLLRRSSLAFLNNFKDDLRARMQLPFRFQENGRLLKWHLASCRSPCRGTRPAMALGKVCKPQPYLPSLSLPPLIPAEA
ncbi:hypothetical protein KGM_200696 [Danaus plexippus plexippus]|uniref:Uncharacterized protein n=1 Tax=Danaus plexippus plexippus TaxID=278856 RepID=A0A212FPC3_DANPL|nr:hypothetical protein KGM_200696 [Danaus plexippus plexippus]